jgi:thiol-disulfide isomerase/thioredoxin
MLVAFTSSCDSSSVSPAGTSPKDVLLEKAENHSSWVAAGIEKIGPARAPVFTVMDLDGNEVSLTDYRGKVVFLNFWATWCPPCKEELPSMDMLQRRYKDDGLLVVALNDYEKKKVVKKFLADTDFSFKVLYDPSGKVSEGYRASFLPTTFFINRDGDVVARAMGFRDWDSPEAHKVIEELLEK